MEKESIREKLRNLEVSLIGNRITAAGITSLIASTGPLYAYSKCNSSSGSSLEEAFFWSNLGVGLFLGGAFIIAGTSFGTGTTEIYKRTKKHIKKFRKLDYRFFKGAMGKERDFAEYCLLQGVYLASRDLGKLDEFHKATEKYPTLIPNF